MELVDDECAWEIMATGEVFAGLAKTRESAERSVAARNHTAELHMRFGDHIITEDRMCLEYVHQGIVTDNWPASQNRPAVGSRFELPRRPVLSARAPCRWSASRTSGSRWGPKRRSLMRSSWVSLGG